MTNFPYADAPTVTQTTGNGNAPVILATVAGTHAESYISGQQIIYG